MATCPSVSVLINNYNYGSFVGEAIESALRQTYKACEVIVVDDGSTDNSREAIAAYGARVRLLPKVNGGQASAFNAGFAASGGEILCFLDSDDLFLPNKLARVVSIFSENPDIGWCFDTPEWFGGSAGERVASGVGCAAGKVNVCDMLSGGDAPYVPTATSGLSFRRKIAERILPMPEVIRITSDNYLKTAALSIAAGWMSSEVLSLQRIHGNNAYTNAATGKRRRLGRTELLTGLCLHQEFPALRRFALKAIYRGSVKMLTSGGIDSELRTLLFAYVRSVGMSTCLPALVKLACMSALGKVTGTRRAKASSESPTPSRQSLS
jgi:CTP:molybdopterin cytidylyltransferase MocA